MYVSYNWLRELTEIKQSPAELDHAMTMLGLEVEGIVDYKEKYKNFFTGEVTKAEKHPDADKLTICEVSTGAENYNVICGAPNVAQGQKIIFAAPGALIPSAGFKIEKRKIRGVESNGMICSETELEIGDDGSGIVVLPEETEPGIPLSDYLELNDIVFDVSLTPNKSDCNSHIGVAREVAAYNKTSVNYPDTNPVEGGNDVNDEIKIEIEDTENCYRYIGRVVKGIKAGPSPEWLKQRLTAIGQRPVNVVVDVTNYVLMEYGQPLHAFDLKEVQGRKIIVKRAAKGDKFTTLDSKERELDDNMLMICDAERQIAVAGVMGGENSEVSDETTDILIESAYFFPTSVRKTSKKLGIQSEASYRFERGVDIENVEAAADRAAKLIAELAGGTVCKGKVDAYPVKQEKLKLNLRYAKARRVTGIDVSDSEIKEIFENLNFPIIEENDEGLTLEIPPYRVDISYEIDLIEEVARMYNYDNIQPDYSSVINFGAVKVPEHLAVPALRGRIRDYLIPRGFKEIITQNITDPTSASIFTDNPIKISNPLGEELSVMRPSLIPSMLKTIERNIRFGNHDLCFFELGKAFSHVDDREDTFIKGHKEQEYLLIAMTGNKAPVNWNSERGNADFYDIKGVFEEMISFFRLRSFKLQAKADENGIFGGNSLAVKYRKDIIGRLGELSGKLLKKFDIDVPVFVCLLDMEQLYATDIKHPQYSPVAPFPGSKRDLGFIVDKEVNSGEIKTMIDNKGGKYLQNTTIFDVYEGKNIGEDKKSVAFSLLFASPKKTLTDNEVDAAVNGIVKAVEKKFQAELRKF